MSQRRTSRLAAPVDWHGDERSNRSLPFFDVWYMRKTMNAEEKAACACRCVRVWVGGWV